MSSINVIACDPGSTGAMCLLKLNSLKQPDIHFINNSRPELEIHDWLSQIVFNYPIRMMMIEDVHSLFGMSAKTNFVFGKNLGISTTLLRLQNVGLDLVQPKEWQKFIGIKAVPKGQKKRTPVQLKKEIAGICERLYPSCNIRGPKGGLLDGRSDALMIAHYCAHKYK